MLIRNLGATIVGCPCVNATGRGRRGLLHLWIVFSVCSIFVVGCSGDPHAIAIDSDHKEHFSSLVTGTKGLTTDELVLLTNAESRATKSHASQTIVGRTIGDVIADQRQWETVRQQLLGKLEAVYRSAKSIQGATSVGVTFAKYGELLQGAATELNVANDKLSTEEERRVAALFKATFEMGHDARTLWQHQIDNARYEDLFLGGVSYTLGKSMPPPEIRRIVDTYHLPVHDGQLKYGQGPFRFLTKNSMQLIWVAADVKLSEAVDAYLAK